MLSSIVQSLPLAVAVPKFGRTRELIQGKFRFDLAACPTAIMKEEAIAIAGEYERHIQRLCIAKSLLHTGANRVLVILRLDHSDRQVGLVVEDEVCTACFAPTVKLATDHNPAFGEADLLTHLFVHVPPRLLDSWGDVFTADVPLGK
ncbi:hypothetical protein D3C76_1170480 [compost metagenome]